jgi:pimeloyl-ACP methyl ester carboxylesterase
LPEAKPFHLLGESFGGPLAIMLAARSHQQLRSLVLCASFLHFPQPLLRALAPLGGFAHAALVPDPLLSWFTFGTWSTPTKMPTLRASIQELSGETLRCRLRAVLRVDVASLLPTITAPILYLQATDDRIVPASAARAIQRIAPAACIEPIAGPHLLLQTQPKTCAREIRRHLDAIGDPATPL